MAVEARAEPAVLDATANPAAKAKMAELAAAATPLVAMARPAKIAGDSSLPPTGHPHSRRQRHFGQRHAISPPGLSKENEVEEKRK